MNIKDRAGFFKNKINSSSVFKKDGGVSVKKIRFAALSSLDKIKKEPSLFGETRILLVPFKTLVISPFSFPFGRKGRVRDALTLSFRPLLGERIYALNRTADNRTDIKPHKRHSLVCRKIGNRGDRVFGRG